MKIKLTPANCEEVTSKTSGKKFWIGHAEEVDPAGQWKTCRWTIMSDRPFPVGPAEYSVVFYDSRKGEGNARPLV